MKTKQTPTRYQVEWCSNLPLTEEGDADRDRATYSRKAFVKFEDAVAFAKDILTKKLDAYGSCEVEFQEYLLDADILENEERTVYRWFSLKNVFVDELDYEYSEKDLEYVQY